jgi:formylglycine-generating enzyme required for sulfatase activity
VFPVGLLTCVTGVSGSGKSTLINDTLYRIAARELNGATVAPAPFGSIEGLGQFDKVVGGHIGSYRGRSLPVDLVSWNDASLMARELGARSKATLRLPTEAEWEYACRAGGAHDTYCGAGSLAAIAWGGDAPAGLHAVGDLRPNAWGIHDMSGNVREWTLDCWHDNYQGAPADGSAWTAGGDCTRRVERGGAWKGATSTLRAAKRSRTAAGLQVNYVGFRLVREP